MVVYFNLHYFSVNVHKVLHTINSNLTHKEYKYAEKGKNAKENHKDFLQRAQVLKLAGMDLK